MKEQISNENFENGSVNISEEVISVIASLAANEIEGVAKMSKGLAGDISEMLGMKNLSKGVTVELEDNNVSINVYIAIVYGYKIKELAYEVQKNVKEKVETMTGLNVVDLNINVQEVIVSNKNKEDNSQDN